MTIDLRIPPVSLRQQWAPQGIEVTPDVAVTGITVSSTEVLPGMVFAAVPGANTHGAVFGADAVARGAAAIVTDASGAELLTTDVPVVVIDDVRSRLGALSAAVYGHPAGSLLTFAVTGTNGKTTTTWLLESCLQQAGRHPALLGTVGARVGDDVVDIDRTTPEAPLLQAVLAYVVRHGARSAAMEVSSHALAQGRADGFVVDVAGFTNLGRDHLDFHPSMAEYEAAKQLLFTPDHSTAAVVVVDDEAGRRVAQRSRVPTTTLTTRDGQEADWQVGDVTALPSGGSRFTVTRDAQPPLELEVLLPGRFNIANAALASAMLLTAGIDAEAIASGIRSVRTVPGRMETVDQGQDFVALVDYAHTPDALRVVLDGVRPRASDGRVIVVFGCGGDRDPGKRMLMGSIAAQLADIVIVTDDNPRHEQASDIRAAVVAGAHAVASAAVVEEIGDRAAAIRRAVSLATAGDVLVVAGKGHEPGQQVGDDMLPFDDRDALAAALQAERTTQP